jgi:uncharacterized membrane protein YcaP (DUF421 family)
MDIVVRAAVAYLFVLLLTRIVGRRELSTLEPFDLIMLVVIGDLIQQGVTQSDYSVIGLLLAGGSIAMMQLAISWLGFRSPSKIGKVLEGEPMVLVQDGRFIGQNLRRERLTEEEVLSDARVDNIATLAEIEWAILETSGDITFIKKSES